MNSDVFITCAVTGAGATADKSELVPVTPEEIAAAAIEAGEGGAAVVHIHVRDPATGKGARDPALYREVVERIRSSDVDVVINLSAGMGGDLVLGGDEAPLPLDADGTDMAGAAERLAHVEELMPEICTLDCGSMNFAAGGDYVLVNTPGILRAMARRIQELGVRPELEVFDSGHLVLVKELIGEGLIDDPVLIQLCMGIPYGAPEDPTTLLTMVRPAAGRLCVLGLLDRPHAAAVCRHGGAGGRQRARGAGGQHLPLARRARDQPAARRAGGDDPRGDERNGSSAPTRCGRSWGCEAMAERAGPRPRSVGLLGGGVIGGGWAARFLLNGVDVRLFDPDPEAARKVEAMLVNARRAYRKLTLAPLPAEGELTLVASVEEAVAGVDFVQESVPEREEVKRALLASGVPRGRPRRRVRLVDVRPSTRRACRPTWSIPSAWRSGIHSTPSTCSRSSRCAAASEPRRRRSSGPRPSTAPWGCGRSSCARRWRGSWRTACWRRCGARRCGSSTTTWRPSRRSTTRSATAQACAGRSWAPS